MSCANEVHKNDIGTKFLITLEDDGEVLDISGATVKKIYFLKPSGATLNKDATFETDGTDGKLHYISESGNLDETGVWTIQANVTLPTGAWRSSKKTFEVFSNIIDAN